MPGERPAVERESVCLAAGAAEELPMFDFSSDYDPVTPAGGRLLDELGLDARSVRDALADDLARRCPDREARTDRS